MGTFGKTFNGGRLAYDSFWLGCLLALDTMETLDGRDRLGIPDCRVTNANIVYILECGCAILTEVAGVG